MGCSDIDISDEALACHTMSTGCLFDLKTDACEHRNVGDENTEVRDYLISRLDYYQSIAGPILINAGSDMNETVWDPASQGSMFWGPYFSYDNTFFEETLQEKYQELYPADSTLSDGSSSRTAAEIKEMFEAASSVPNSSRSTNLKYSVVSWSTVGLVAVLMTMIMVFRRFWPSSGRKTISEVAPLLAVSSVD